jgi:hypothetical protein
VQKPQLQVYAFLRFRLSEEDTLLSLHEFWKQSPIFLQKDAEEKERQGQ